MEQFLFALYPEGKYWLLKSPGVSQLISDMNFQILRKYPNPEEPLWLDTEKVVAVQFVDRATVDYREGIWNHTFLIPVKEYIHITNPHKLLDKFFIHKTDILPTHLDSIKID